MISSQIFFFVKNPIIELYYYYHHKNVFLSGSGKLLENRIRVTIGEHDLKIKNSKEIDKKVIKIHFHPKYQCGKFIDDIALLELENDIYWTKSIGPACLPKNYDNDNDLTNRSATLAGWGWLNEKYSEGMK